MFNNIFRSQTLPSAIQIVNSREEDDGRGGTQNVIETDEHGPSLREILCSRDLTDTKIFVFSITGKTRTGKSFLLNLMAKYLECKGSSRWKEGTIPAVFDWKGGVSSVTKGLWICPKIYFTTNQENQKVGILLLDNQGLFDGEQTDGLSTAMSGISTAISFYQMFNLKENITTAELESIWRHLAMNFPEDESAAPRLMFVVRDFIDVENGCGLHAGQRYISGETVRGTKEHKDMWQNLSRIFSELECLLLPHPGLKVQRSCFRESRLLTDIEGEFLEEVDEFFKVIFAPENLPATGGLKGSQIYDILEGANGKVANEDLSFFNVFTEHGNDKKLEDLLNEFESRQRYSQLSLLPGVMESILNTANKKFKGCSKDKFVSTLKERLVEKVNAILKDSIISTYTKTLHSNPREDHKCGWPSAVQRLKLLVGDKDQKKAAQQSIILITACIYYEELSKHMLRQFEPICMNKSLKELEGFDVKYTSDFKQNDDFQIAGCTKEALYPVWLGARQSLSHQVQHKLLVMVAKLTDEEFEWLYTAKKEQYEYFEAFTWVNAVKSPFHWSEIKKGSKGSDRLVEIISYALFKNSLSDCSEDQQNSIKNIADKLVEKSPDSKMEISCIYVFYRDNKKACSAPVFKVKTKSGVIFVDNLARVYTDWNNYMETNMLPDCVYCYPVNGEYNKRVGFQVGFTKSPAAADGQTILKVLDVVGKVVVIGAVSLAAIATAPAVVIGGSIAAAAGGTYGIVRGVSTIVDKVAHEQPVVAVDVVNAVGNGLAVATPVISAAAALFTNSVREARVMQFIVQGCRSLVTLFLGADDNTNTKVLLSEIGEITQKILFYFNSKSSDEAITNIKESYDLGKDICKQDVIRELVSYNSIDSVVRDEDMQATHLFVSSGVKSIIVDLLKFVSYDLSSPLYKFINPSSRHSLHQNMDKLFHDLKSEHTSINSGLTKFVHRLNTSGDLNALIEAIANATGLEKNQFSLLLRNLIYSFTSKLENASRVYNSIEHEGFKLNSYNGVEFHPVEEALAQINSTRVDTINDCINKDNDGPLPCLVRKVLTAVCNVGDSTWDLQRFSECLLGMCAELSQSFDTNLKDHQKQAKRFANSNCSYCNSILEVNAEVGLGPRLLEKLLDKIKLNMKIDTRRTGDNIIILPAYNGLEPHLYFYTLGQNKQRVTFKQLVEQLTRKPLKNYEEVTQECMCTLRPKRGGSPSYYIYRGSMDDQECGLIFCNE